MWVPRGWHVADRGVAFQRAMGREVAVKSERMLDVVIREPMDIRSCVRVAGRLKNCKTAGVFEALDIVAMLLEVMTRKGPVGENAFDLAA